MSTEFTTIMEEMGMTEDQQVLFSEWFDTVFKNPKDCRVERDMRAHAAWRGWAECAKLHREKLQDLEAQLKNEKHEHSVTTFGFDEAVTQRDAAERVEEEARVRIKELEMLDLETLEAENISWHNKLKELEAENDRAQMRIMDLKAENLRAWAAASSTEAEAGSLRVQRLADIGTITQLRIENAKLYEENERLRFELRTQDEE